MVHLVAIETAHLAKEIGIVENLDLEHQGDLEVYERLYLAQLEKRYEISRSTLTNRMNRLGLVTQQDRGGAPGFLGVDDVAKLDELYHYIKAKGSDAGFRYPQLSAIAPMQQSAIAQTSASELSESTPETAELLEAQRPGAAGYAAINPDRMMGEALTRATENLMAQEMARNFTNNPHLLPPHLQQQISQYTNELRRGMPQPKSPDPVELAQQILQRVKLHQQQNQQ